MASRAEWPRPLFGRRHYRPLQPLFCDTGQIVGFVPRESTGTAENPKLVWTASQVVLISKEDARSIGAFPDDAQAKDAAGIPVPTIRWGSSETMVPQLLVDSWRRSDPRGRLPLCHCQASSLMPRYRRGNRTGYYRIQLLSAGTVTLVTKNPRCVDAVPARPASAGLSGRFATRPDGSLGE